MADDDLRARGISNEIKGSLKEAQGKIRDAAADITGDTSEQIKGKAKTAEGKIQKNFGRLEQDAADDT